MLGFDVSPSFWAGLELPLFAAACLVIILDGLWPLGLRYSPLTYCRLFAIALANKVNRNNASEDQQKLSGLLALITYVAFMGTIAAALLFVMPYDVLTESVLLYLSLGYNAYAKQTKLIEDALSNGQNSVAKQYLTPWTTINTQRLSPLGITKMALEVKISLWFSRWLVPLVLFVLFGGVYSFVYALMWSAISAWPTANPIYRSFGVWPQRIKSVFDWPFTALFLPLVAIFKSSPGWLDIAFKHRSQWPSFQSGNDLFWLAMVAAGCKIEMAGPVMFDDTKVSRVRLAYGVKPDHQAITQLRHWLTRVNVFFVAMLVLFWTLANFSV